MALSQDLTEMLDALRRAKQDLDDSFSPFLDAEPPDVPSLARLQELAERNAQSAKLLGLILQGQALDTVLQGILPRGHEGAMAYFEGVAAGLEARIHQAGRE